MSKSALSVYLIWGLQRGDVTKIDREKSFSRLRKKLDCRSVAANKSAALQHRSLRCCWQILAWRSSFVMWFVGLRWVTTRQSHIQKECVGIIDSAELMEDNRRTFAHSVQIEWGDFQNDMSWWDTRNQCQSPHSNGKYRCMSNLHTPQWYLSKYFRHL